MANAAMADNFSSRKMRWLNSIFFDPTIKATTCRIAYVIGDYLNRHTGDAWPAQATIARKIGACPKTVYRAIKELERRGQLSVRRGGRAGTLRYAPIFVSNVRHPCPPTSDLRVQESYLDKLLRTNLGATGVANAKGRVRNLARGHYEIEIAERLRKELGIDGMAVLGFLAQIDDHIVAQMCERQQAGTLSSEELQAAAVWSRRDNPH
jgi:hypothetical protein